VSLSVQDSGSSSAVIAGMSAVVVLLFVTVTVAVICYRHMIYTQRRKPGKYNIKLIIQNVGRFIVQK